MTLTVSFAEGFAASAVEHFTAVCVDGRWHVRDAESERYVVHDVAWDEAAALDVAATFTRLPSLACSWDWTVDPAEVVA